MKMIDGFLSRLAQTQWPDALVWKEEMAPEGDKGPSERFILERQDKDVIILGRRFPEARAGLAAFMTSERSRAKAKEGK